MLPTSLASKGHFWARLGQRLLIGPPGRSEARNWLFGAGVVEPGMEIRMDSPSTRARPEPELPALTEPSRASQEAQDANNEKR